MRNFNFMIDRRLDAKLKAEHKRTGTPMSEIVRRAINRYLTEREENSLNGNGQRPAGRQG
jgi:predicted DNA-binding protein